MRVRAPLLLVGAAGILSLALRLTIARPDPLRHHADRTILDLLRGLAGEGCAVSCVPLCRALLRRTEERGTTTLDGQYNCGSPRAGSPKYSACATPRGRRTRGARAMAWHGGMGANAHAMAMWASRGYTMGHDGRSGLTRIRSRMARRRRAGAPPRDAERRRYRATRRGTTTIPDSIRDGAVRGYRSRGYSNDTTPTAL